MNIGENNNEYAIYVIFTRDKVDESHVVDKLISLSKNNNDLIYCRNCSDKEGNSLNRFICCIKKTFYEHLLEKCDFKRDGEFNITKYRVNNHPLNNGTTYGFYIKCDDADEMKIREIFDKFEHNNFIRKGSYQINKPGNYPDGRSRGYIIISFSKQDDKYPKQYIRKLKALLNNSKINDKRIYINWASNSVLKDILSNSSKSQRESN